MAGRCTSLHMKNKERNALEFNSNLHGLEGSVHITHGQTHAWEG